MASGNPVLRESIFTSAEGQSAMTLNGVVNKTGILLVLCMGSFAFAWYQSASALGPIAGVGMIGGLILGLITCFAPKAAPFTAPVYAVLEGLFLGAISALAEAGFPGIAIQAAGLTFGTVAVMLTLYLTRVIRVTETLKSAVIVATGAIALVYLVGLVLRMFGSQIPFIHEAGPIGIVFSLFVVGLAAFNLLLDFDFIEQGVGQCAPKHLEWYAGFSLLVTLVWLYLEILRLLMKLRSLSRFASGD